MDWLDFRDDWLIFKYKALIDTSDKVDILKIYDELEDMWIIASVKANFGNKAHYQALVNINYLLEYAGKIYNRRTV